MSLLKKGAKKYAKKPSMKPVDETSDTILTQTPTAQCDSVETLPIEKSHKKHSAEHLKPYWFQTGQSGNPGGKPSKKPMSQALNNELDRTYKDSTKREHVVKRLVNMAIAGNIEAIKVIYDRMDGKPSSDDMDKSIQILIQNRVPTSIPLLAEPADPAEIEDATELQVEVQSNQEDETEIKSNE